jgi:hypothetical protein
MTANAATAHVAHLLPGYAAGTLDPAARDGVEAHLPGCAACRAELAAWQAIGRAARDVYRLEASASDATLQQVFHRIDGGSNGARALPADEADTVTIADPASPAPMPRALPQPPGRRILAQLATAALVLLTLVGSFLAFGPNRPGRQDDARLLIPAISGTPATPPAISVEILLDTTIDNLPTGRSRVVVETWSVRRGPRTPNLPPMGGPFIVAVESGALTFTEGGRTRELTAGNHLTFSGADAIEYQPGESGITSAYAVYFVPSLDAPAVRSDPVANRFSSPINDSADDLPGGAARVLLERLTVPLGGALPPETARPWVWTDVEAGVLGLTLAGDHLPFRWEAGAERVIRPGDSIPVIAPGTAVTMRNAGDTPLVLYRLTIDPDAAAVATPDGASGDTTTAAGGSAAAILDTVLESLPTGHAIVGVRRWTLRPSPSALNVPPLGGPGIFAVASGEVSATVDGVERRLAAGQHLSLPGDTGASFRAAGAQDAVAFQVYLVPTYSTAGRGLGETGGTESWSYDQIAYTTDYLIAASPDALPGGPARLILDQIIVPPGSALPPEDAAPLTWTEVATGVLGLTLEGERLPFRWTSGDERTFRPGQKLPITHPGTTLTMRNAGDAPLVLYRLTVIPGDAAAPGDAVPDATPRPP